MPRKYKVNISLNVEVEIHCDLLPIRVRIEPQKVIGLLKGKIRRSGGRQATRSAGIEGEVVGACQAAIGLGSSTGGAADEAATAEKRTGVVIIEVVASIAAALT